MSNNIYAQLDDHCRGYARIRLDDIEFDSRRDLDSRNVKRLLGIFKRNCERENLGNAISVVVKKGNSCQLAPAGVPFADDSHSCPR